MKYANPKAHELSLKLCKQKSSNPDTCSVWGSMLNGKLLIINIVNNNITKLILIKYDK